MTAEIAILNKTAIALAADSAVTLSTGSDQQKIFDSEDKLFELTRGNAIAVMINSDMNFMEAPLPVLIKRYRGSAPTFRTVRDAADHFLHHLDEFVRESPARIEQSVMDELAQSMFSQISARARDSFFKRIIDPATSGLREEFVGETERLPELAEEMHEQQVAVLERAIGALEDAQFFGDGLPSLGDKERDRLHQLALENLSMATDSQRERAIALVEIALRKRGVGGSTTGVVIAGYGSDELFPSLISLELYGACGNRLKYAETDYVDIDRDGDRARVLPLAQREMVERFLYGLDADIERQIASFARSAVPSIAQQIIGSLDMDETERAELLSEAEEAEKAFYAGLELQGFETIRAQSREEIEDMVEFMPKPEMARMAEALVNLTSIKRRVSRGFETVGGPIDVAVISKAEGFVWVRRKHYFNRELNERYFDRMRSQPTDQAQEG